MRVSKENIVIRGVSAEKRAETYARFAHLHYRAGKPGPCVAMLAAREGRLEVGVLCVSMPVLNGAWRGVAWPEEFGERLRDEETERRSEDMKVGRAGRQRAEARCHGRRVNAHVRVISRVIVLPAWRGRGVASGLVRGYLARPLTKYTEAIAAMGEFCPVFERAGMRRVDVPESAHDRALRGALGELELWRLVDVREAARVLGARKRLRKEVDRWADASRATRGKGESRAELLARAAGKLISEPAVWVHSKWGK